MPITFVLAAPAGDRAGRRTPDRLAPARLGPVPRLGRAATLPEAVYVPTLSTAAAAAGLDPAAEAAPAYDAALCPPIAAELHGLTVLAHDVGDNPSAVTRFVLVSRPGAVPAPTGSDKTTLVAYQTDDHPGGLVEMLEQFAVRGVNLTRLESRPTGDALGQYCFSIDCEGHIAEARVGEALMGLHRTCARVTYLGSYPRAVAPGRVNGSTAPSRRPGTSEADFTAAEEWIERLRPGAPDPAVPARLLPSAGCSSNAANPGPGAPKTCFRAANQQPRAATTGDDGVGLGVGLGVGHRVGLGGLRHPDGEGQPVEVDLDGAHLGHDVAVDLHRLRVVDGDPQAAAAAVLDPLVAGTAPGQHPAGHRGPADHAVRGQGQQCRGSRRRSGRPASG